MKRVYYANKRYDNPQLKDFTHIRAYHACRPLSLDKYLSEGIRPMSHAELFQEAAIRLKGRYNSNEELETAFHSACTLDGDLPGQEPSVVFLGVSKEELLGESGHYLIYGSELLQGTAVRLAPNVYYADEFRNTLKRSGRPTLFACDIPIEEIDKAFLQSIALPIEGECTICVPWVPPQNISAILFPESVFDPILRGARYRYMPDQKRKD